MMNSNSIIRWRFCGFWVFMVLIAAQIDNVCECARSDKEIRERFYGKNLFNSTPPDSEDTIAKMIDHVLEKEFSDNEQPEGSDARSFNNSVADQQAEIETVVKITHEKAKKNETGEANGTKSFQFQDVFSTENEESDDMATLIDKKVIVGYLLAGSMIGPGGLKCISELVQVETVAQFGVVFLLFALGLEFSMSKLRAVGPVAVLGGMLQIIIFMFLCGITTTICGGKLSEGVFVGSFLSMSSTAVVVKFLAERNYSNALHGQVTIGTLIFQDCAVGLLFALVPVLGGNSGLLQGIISMGRLLVILFLYLTTASILTWSFIPRFLKLMIQLSSQVEPIRNLFAALFLPSIGMLIHVQFLWNHVDILLASVILVVVFKTSVAAVVTKAFGYSIRTSFLVGLSLAQIGEFAFVLLSRTSNLHLVEGKVYLLLLGTTALSLVTTPILFKLMPAVVHFGILMHWFPSESSIQNEELTTKQQSR